jgi:hypothetical protein
MPSVFENLVKPKKRRVTEEVSMAPATEKSVGAMNSYEYDAALRSNPELTQGAVRHVDLSKPGNGERYAILKPCAGCAKDTVVSSEHQGNVFCSEACQRETFSTIAAFREILWKFAETTPEFYRCPYNTTQLVAAWRAQPLDLTVDNLKSVFARLQSEGRVLPHISLAELRNLPSDAYDQRLRLDPDLGGHVTELDKKPVAGNSFRNGAPVESSSQAQTNRMAEQERKQVDASIYARQYGGASHFTNGMQVDAPTTLEHNVVFRNGRRIS